MLYSAEQDAVLSKEERDEVKVLAPREAARKLIEAVYHAAGSTIELERALEGVSKGLVLANSADAGRRMLGYVVGLQALLAAPEAVHAAVRVIHDELLATDPELRSALDTLIPVA